ncbi:MAG TPA: pyridoxal-phosphate dependent enzyme, partial [Nitrososphaerales archaeon]|nr:pyridoxal-phosphate dependent enzyme [Nitrososphaerales archaeon]
MKQEVTLKDIEAAESRIRKYIPQTPLEFSPRLSESIKGEVYLKLEVFQPIRVFKIRGALNKILSLPDTSVRRGVITASSGNHGLAVAYASRVFGIDATVCVPTKANPQKVAAIEEQGAKIIRSGISYDDTYLSARRIASRRRLTFLHAFDDKEVVAGQGTCGLEIARQASDLSAAVVSIGGGGLISGISIALKSLLAGASVHGVQTTASPSMYESVRLGKIRGVRRRPTIADGMQATPGRL